MASNAHDRIKIPASFWEALPQMGIRVEELLHKARVPIDSLAEPVVLNTAQYFAVWQTFSELIDEPATGIFNFMKSVNTAQLAPSVLAAYHARNYREALSRMERYKQLCSPERFHIEEEGEICTIQVEWLRSTMPAPALVDAMAFASLLQIGRHGIGRSIDARLVEFTHPLGNPMILEDFFGCEVRFGALHNRLTLNRSDLDLPFISYNAELLEILTPALDLSLGEQQRRDSITETVKKILKHSLPGGRSDVQRVAGELAVSERTLQRRLTDQGTSFKELLTQARREMAREYLLDPSVDIKEVAFLLGYEELNSFYRAFRHWEGDTPSNWRSEQLGSNAVLPPLH